MEIIAASAKLSGDARSRQLIEHLTSMEGPLQVVDGVIYFDFPLFRDTDDVLYRSQVLLASRSHGIAAFSVPSLTGRAPDVSTIGRIDDAVSQLASIILGKLLKSKVLRKSSRELKVPVQGFIFLPDIDEHGAFPTDSLESVLIHSFNTLDDWLRENRADVLLTDDAWDELRSSLEGAKGLVRPKERDVRAQAPNSKPALLARLESEVANFDANQRRAAIQIVDGPQRIRGLAGSGKTIVLAMKAAHLHLNDPDSFILVTFYTKSLYAFLKRLITRFYRQFTDRDPNWDRIHIRHGWGGRTNAGTYYDACITAGVAPLTLPATAGRGGFEFACSELLATGKVTAKYAYVLIDEAQDFPPSFFQLCFALARGGRYDRNIVWAYDELQNIINIRMRSPVETFGVDATQTPLIDLDRASAASLSDAHDIVLHKCYRNPRELLVTAHALGFGIYSDQPVQMLENAEHWTDVGYVVEEGECIPGQSTVILRPEQNSPLSISRSQTPEEMLSLFRAADADAEVDHVVSSILSLIGEGLRPDDMMVIALDDRYAKRYLQAIGNKLVEADIRVNNMLSDPYTAPPFVIDDHVTLTTVYRAKGNEAAVVFAVGIDALYESRKIQRGRNKIFTAFTRAKAWLRVTGVGNEAEFYFREIRVALENLPRLRFIYPDPAALVTIQRDLTDRAVKMHKLRVKLEEQIDLLDLDPEEAEQLVASLFRRRK